MNTQIDERNFLTLTHLSKIAAAMHASHIAAANQAARAELEAAAAAVQRDRIFLSPTHHDPTEVDGDPRRIEMHCV